MTYFLSICDILYHYDISLYIVQHVAYMCLFLGISAIAKRCSKWYINL